MTDQKREEQAEAATTFLTELLKGKDGVTRVEEEAEKLEVGRAFLRACVGDRAVAVREMWQIKSALGRLGGLMWAAVDPESLRNSGLGGVGPNSIHEVATAAHGVLQLGGADSGGGLSDDGGASTSFLGPVTTLIEAWAPCWQLSGWLGAQPFHVCEVTTSRTVVYRRERLR